MAKKMSVKANLDGLLKMGRALKVMADGKYHVRVGIFGAKNSRSSGGTLTNAELGYIHEMGSPKRHIPERSFLRYPLMSHGAQLVAATKDDLVNLFRNGKVDAYLKRVGEAAVSIVKEAFDTAGWGTWPQDAYATILRKLGKTKMSRARRTMEAMKAAIGGHSGINSPLIDSGQMRHAVTSRVV